MIKYRLYGKLNEKSIKACFDKICSVTYKQLNMCENLVFDVNIVDSKTIKHINKKYRNKDKVTDVISFALDDELEDSDEPELIGGPEEHLLGDIIISAETAQRQGEE